MLKDNLLEIGMPSAIEATKRNEGFVREITEHGEESFSAYTYQKDYRDLPNLNWSLILVQSPDRVFASIKSLKRANVFTLLGFMLLATVASLVLSDAICRPILKTAETAQAINRGDLEKRVPVESNDEIGILSKSFNEMVEKFVRSNINFRESLEQRRRAEKILGNLNDELESTVSKLEEANQDMKDFVYIASHDLRQPLRAITSFGQLLERSIGGSLDEENKENLGFMIDGALRMNQMIEDLLVYSRVTTKEIKFEAIDLNEVVEQLEQIEVAAALSEADGTIEVPEALPTVKVNRGQISQLLQNFIANGLKYLAEGVKPSIVVTSEETGDGKVKIMVTDNGIGIDDKYKGEVFKMFRRLHSRSEYEGTGIGLAVCKKIVDRHNGQIGVESEVGKGSTFWFTVPVAMGEAKASVEAVGV
jgi:signal transduction histidine kinase